jgi:hypothetical protein
MTVSLCFGVTCVARFLWTSMCIPFSLFVKVWKDPSVRHVCVYQWGNFVEVFYFLFTEVALT